MSEARDTDLSEMAPSEPPTTDPIVAAFRSLLDEHRRTTAEWHRTLLEKYEQTAREHAAAGNALVQLTERQETMLKMMASFFDQLQEIAPTLQKTRDAVAEHETRIGALEIRADRGTLLPPPRGNGSDHTDDG